MTEPTYGALFAGMGGLEIGVQAVLGGSTAWHSEIEPAAVRILEHHWPGVPNLGDISAVDWTGVAPVDVLTGGFPCQDVSHAGKRAGIAPGTRSGLWSEMQRAIKVLRPSLVVAENVRGLLSAKAAGDVECCAWCVGDGEGEPPLRALGAVLGDLAELGYDAWWVGLRAADTGAPHSRFRVFVFAWPAEHSDGGGREAGGRLAAGPRVARGDDAGRASVDAAADAADDGLPRAGAPRAGGDGPADRGDAPADASGERHGGGEDGRALGRADGPAEGEARERGDQGADRRPADRGRGVTSWGDYESAIRRWEHVTGRVAPGPTEPGSKGQPRLAPAFVEWMMGLDEGHVTAVPGVGRNAQLKALGNGVVPQQAELATRMFLEWREAQP